MISHLKNALIFTVYGFAGVAALCLITALFVGPVLLWGFWGLPVSIGVGLFLAGLYVSVDTNDSIPDV